MTTPVLYDYWRSSASYRLRIALNLLAIAHDSVPVNLIAGGHRQPEHLARNPQGLVPALAIDGALLTQSLAILEYLHETRPGAALLPEAPLDRHRVRALAQVIAVDIHPVCNLSVTARVVDLAGGGEEVRVAWMREHIGRGLAALERLLDDPRTGTFCHGEQPTIADLCLVPQVYNARRWGVDLTALPRIVAIDAACTALPAFAEAHPDRIGPPPT